MAGETVLLIDDGGEGERAAGLREAAGDLGAIVRVCSGGDALAACLREAASGDEPAAVVFGPALPNPVAAARQVYRLDPLVQMVFVADAARAAELRRDMGLAPRIGTHWSIADSAGLARSLQEAIRSTRQRRQMRTTLDRLKVRVTGRPAADSADYRKLVVSDRFLASILAHAQDAILSTDPAGTILTWNHAAARLSGRAEADAVGRPVGLLDPDPDAPALSGLVREVGAGAPEVRREVRLRRADGSSLDAEVTLAPVRDEAGRLLAVSVIARDVSERRRAEEAVRQQREWLRVTLTSIGDAVIATDTRGRVTFLNPVAEGLTGWTQEAAAGRPLEEVFVIVNEQTRRPVEHPVARVLREGVVVGLANHTLLIARDGTERPIDDSAAPIRDGSSGLNGVVLIFRDVTEQRRAAGEVRQREARKTAILETALDCIVTMDHEGNVVEFNPAAERTFGYRREQVIGRQLADLIIPPSLRERHHRGMAHYLATGEGPVLGRRLELPALHADGTEFPVELAITRIPVDGPPLFTAYLRDVSEQKRAERHRNVRLAVTHALSEAETVDDGASGVLRAVCENLGWDVGFFWTVSEEEKVLACRRSWHRSGVSVDEFEAASCHRTFKRGEGLPGRVWASGKPAWILDIAQDRNFPRLASAVNYDLHSAFACPVVVGDHTVGVIEFFTNRIREADADLLEMMETVAGGVGQFIERKAAEDELRRSERELADFFENATVGLHWVGADGTILRANKAELDMLGYSAEEYVGRPITDFHADEDVICDILKRLQAGEKLDEYPARLRCKDGSIRDVLIDSSVMWRDGSFVHTRCFTRDVSERKRAEAALRESEAKLRLLADTIPQLAWMARPDGHIFWYNRRWHEYTGTTPEQMEGWGWQSVHDPDMLPKVLERWKASIASGEPFDMVFPLRGADGQFRPFLTRINPLRGEQGRILYWFGTNTDISEQKRAEDASRFLADASAALAAVVDYESTLGKVARLAVPFFADWCAVDMAEPGGALRRLAVAHRDPSKVELAEELYRRYPPRPDDPYGPPHVLRTGLPEMASEVTDSLLAALAQDEEHLRILRGLALRSYLCVPLAVRGRPLGVITFVTSESGRRYGPADLTLAEDLAHRAAVALDNARLYAELKEADRRKDEFLATLAHELRNPLAPIRNSLQILKMPRVEPATAAKAREMMERQVHHMVRLVDDLLDVSRVMRGKITLQNEPVELATVVARAVETAKPLIEAQQHELEIAIPDEPLPLEADPVRLTQVVGNLLTNAAKYSDPRGHIRVAARRDGGQAVLAVRDRGIGIAPDVLPHVFELFVQADHATTKAQGGLGIGLTLVKNLVELHGGTVEARSEGLGRGSEFVIRLPLAGRRSHQPQGMGGADPGQAPPASGRRVLVVDDNRDAADSLAALLRLQGHEVRVANDGSAGLEAAAEFRPDLILLDIGMPGMDGYEVARRVRATPGLEGVVLAALTGWGQAEDRRRTAEAGFDHHLVKPVEPTALDRLLAGLEAGTA